MNKLESRLIGLCMRIESKPILAHPWPHIFESDASNYPFSCCLYIGVQPINLQPGESGNCGTLFLLASALDTSYRRPNPLVVVSRNLERSWTGPPP